MNQTTTLCRHALAAAALLLATTVAARADELKDLRISTQPTMTSLPLFIASEKGWWAEAGLKVTITNFPAGVPQIAASKSWDIGVIGAPPAVLGAVRFGLQTIAFSEDQSTTMGLYVRGPKTAAILKEPSTALKGMAIGLTPSSTGDLAARSCLKKFGLAKGDVAIKGMGQPEIVAAMQSGSLEIGSVWAPNTYLLEEKSDAKSLCTAKDAGVGLYGAVVTRGEWARQNSDEVARFLAVYLHAQRYIAANRKEVVALAKRFSDGDGIGLNEASITKELDARPTFNLATQVAMFGGGATASKADTAMGTIAGFLKDVGTLRADEAMPESKTYVTGEYLKLVEQNPKLKALANKSN